MTGSKLVLWKWSCFQFFSTSFSSTHLHKSLASDVFSNFNHPLVVTRKFLFHWSWWDDAKKGHTNDEEKEMVFTVITINIKSITIHSINDLNFIYCPSDDDDGGFGHKTINVSIADGFSCVAASLWRFHSLLTLIRQPTVSIEINIVFYMMPISSRKVNGDDEGMSIFELL